MIMLKGKKEGTKMERENGRCGLYMPKHHELNDVQSLGDMLDSVRMMVSSNSRVLIGLISLSGHICHHYLVSFNDLTLLYGERPVIHIDRQEEKKLKRHN